MVKSLLVLVLLFTLFKTSVMENPRFPHSILITRVVSVDVTDPTEEVPYDPFAEPPAVPPETGDSTTSTVEVYHGEGRNYKNNKTSPVNGVIQSDYAASIPYTEIDIKTGDSIVVTERVRTISGIVDDAYLGNLGLTVYWNKVNN